MEQMPYSTFSLIALSIVITGSFLWAIKRSFPPLPVCITLLFTAISAFIGARLLYAASTPQRYISGNANVWDLGFHGFSLYGGIVLALVTAIAMTKIFRLDRDTLSDIIAPFIGIGIAIMRIGCFLHGCCFGKETGVPWGIRFPYLSPAHLHQLQNAGADPFEVHPVHATQLYELSAAILGSILSIYIIKRKAPPGVAALSFALWFSVFRLGNHYLREPSSPFDASPYIYPAVYILFILLSTILIKRKFITQPV